MIWIVTGDHQALTLAVAEIRHKTEGGEKFLPEWDVEIRDESGELVARVHKVLYVREKR